MHAHRRAGTLTMDAVLVTAASAASVQQQSREVDRTSRTSSTTQGIGNTYMCSTVRIAHTYIYNTALAVRMRGAQRLAFPCAGTHQHIYVLVFACVPLPYGYGPSTPPVLLL